jgi:hypothetical protein
MSNKLAEQAKLAYIKKELNHLIKVTHLSDIKGLEPGQVLLKSKPYADIVFKDENNQLKYVEIKSTAVNKNKKCFAAITQTELKKSIEEGSNYTFVFMIKVENDFIIGKPFTGREILDSSTLSCPPPKYYLNIDPRTSNFTNTISRKAKTIITSIETVEFHSELEKTSALICSNPDIQVNEENFLSLVTLLKMGDLKDENHRLKCQLYKFIYDRKLTKILPVKSQEDLFNELQLGNLN